MSMLAKLSSSIGFKRFSKNGTSDGKSSNDHGNPSSSLMSKSSNDQSKPPQLATYLLPGSAVVQVSGQSTAKAIASLQPGEKILGIDVAGGSALAWATLQQVERADPISNSILIGLDGNDSVVFKPEQAFLIRDRKKKLSMQSVRRLEIGTDLAVVFNTNRLQSQSKNAQELTKICSRRLVRENTEVFYKLSVGSTHNSLLISGSLDAKNFLVVDPTNSSVDSKALGQRDNFIEIAETAEGPRNKMQVEVKNTFITVEPQCEKEEVGIPRSYSDSDIQRLVAAQEMMEAEMRYKPPFAQGDLASHHTSSLSSESKSNISSLWSKSEASSLSGDSVTQVRVGTQVIQTEDGHKKTNGTALIKLTEFNALHVNEAGVRLPAASVIHKHGRRPTCRKCAFYNPMGKTKESVCKNGALCDFCHGPHYHFIHRR